MDATTREDATKYIISNDLIGYLKSHAVILDLTADPYLTDVNPLFRSKGYRRVYLQVH